MTRTAAPALLAVALFAVLSATGCSPAPPAPSLSPVGRVSAPAAGLRTAGWGVTGGRLSILVRNDGTRWVGSARAVITARDTHGNAVATTSGPIQCCGIAQLAPGATSGLYADLGAAARRVTDVRVRYTDVTLTAPTVAAPVTVADVGLQTGGATTLVTARLTAAGRPGTAEAVRGQAVLTTAGGRIVAVLSQRVACLAAGQPRAVRLALAARVPAGTIVSSWTASTVAAGSC